MHNKGITDGDRERLINDFVWRLKRELFSGTNQKDTMENLGNYWTLAELSITGARRINKARNGDYLPKDQFFELLKERSDVLHQVCLIIDRINDRLNKAASHTFARLPIIEYKLYTEARKTVRDEKKM